MNLEIIETNDGSLTLLSEKFGETYHSTAGAIYESLHIYINNGLKRFNKKELTIFEMGFGLGYNTLLTFIESFENDYYITYYTIDKYPIDYQLIEQIKLPVSLQKYTDAFLYIHSLDWDKMYEITHNFKLKKIKSDFVYYEFDFTFDLCYYDAFSYNVQPELWSYEIFKKIYQAMKPQGLLLTYSSKGLVKENLRKAGFFVKRFKAIGDKRHNLLAIKGKIEDL